MNSAETENPVFPNTGSTTSDAAEHLASVDHAAASETSSPIDSAASALADTGNERLGEVAAGLSEQIRKLSSYFESRGLEEVIGDTRRLVQRNPALFIAGGVVVGFALSRVLTSLEQSRPSRRH